MTAIIKRNYKKIGLVTVAILLVLTLIFSDELLAMVLPSAADLTMISCELSDTEFIYSGEEMMPEVTEIIFQNTKGKEVVKAGEEITIVSYHNNIDFGKGDIEVKVKGYMETAVLEDVFHIIPGQVEELKVEQITEEAVDLSWTPVAGAEGYQIFKKGKADEEFTLIDEVKEGGISSYKDTDITYNMIYEYEVCAFAAVKTEEGTAGEVLYGGISNTVTAYTPLATPVLSEITPKNYNSILVEWQPVEGAIGYQVYRSNSANGEFTSVTEITDASKVSYTDTNCECGKVYYYYVKASQQLETDTVYGKASNMDSAKTIPNQVKLTGKTTETNTKVSLSWKKSEGAQGYEIYKKEGSSDYKLVKKIENPDTLTWSESGLAKDKEYSYRVRPYCTVEGTTVTGSYSNTYVKEKYVAPVVSAPSGTDSNSNSNSNSGSSNSGLSSSGSASGDISGVTKYVGVPYVYGGNTPKGWDCSGFVQWAFKNYYGITFSSRLTAAGLASKGTEVSKSNMSSWQVGDLIFFSNGSKVSHVGLYLGNGQMMHALNEKYDTVIQSVTYYENWDPGNYLVSVRRYR